MGQTRPALFLPYLAFIPQAPLPLACNAFPRPPKQVQGAGPHPWPHRCTVDRHCGIPTGCVRRPLACCLHALAVCTETVCALSRSRHGGHPAHGYKRNLGIMPVLRRTRAEAMALNGAVGANISGRALGPALLHGTLLQPRVPTHNRTVCPPDPSCTCRSAVLLRVKVHLRPHVCRASRRIHSHQCNPAHMRRSLCVEGDGTSLRVCVEGAGNGRCWQWSGWAEGRSLKDASGSAGTTCHCPLAVLDKRYFGDVIAWIGAERVVAASWRELGRGADYRSGC